MPMRLASPANLAVKLARFIAYAQQLKKPSNHIPVSIVRALEFIYIPSWE